MEAILKEILNEVKENSIRLGRVETNVSKLQSDVAGLKQDVAMLKEDVAGLKQDVAILKEDVAGLKQDVAILKKDVSMLKDKVSNLEQVTESMQIDIKANRQMLTGMERRLVERIDGLYDKNNVTERELHKIKDQLEKRDKIDRKWAKDTIKRIDAI